MINFVKDELYDDLFSSISRRFAKESIALPPEMMLWVSGRVDDISISNEKMWEIIFAWRDRATRALNNRDVTLDEFFGVFPEPFRSEFRAELLKKIAEE